MAKSAHNRNRIAMNANSRHRLALTLLLLAEVIVRVYGAWLCRNDTSTDRGRVGIMALHMAQGRDFPVFFYGGAYLGSVEPAASALMIRLFGATGFTLNLGTALLGFLLLPLLYRWAREMSGPNAGLAAAALLMIGPFSYFYFLASPRGGYAAILLFGSMVLWLAGRMVHKALRNEKPAWWESVGLGAAAGLAWWSHQLAAAALLTAALVVALTARTQLRHFCYWLAVPGFFLTSAPWWIWNATHNWATLRLAGSFGAGMPILKGLRLFFGERLWELLDIPSPPIPIAVAITVIFLGGLAIAAIFIARHFLRRKDPTPFACHATVILVFVIVSAVLFAGSHYALNRSTRYLLPLLPPLAVTLGAFGARWKFTARPLVTVVLFAAALSWQTSAVRSAFLAERGKDAAWQDVPRLVQLCRDREIEVLYGNIWQHWINFASQEQCLVCDLMSEPYAPYARAAERATRCALLGNYENLFAFLRATRATGEVSSLGVLAVQHGFTSPTQAAKPVPPQAIVEVRDANNNELAFLTDEVVGEGRDWLVTQTNLPIFQFILAEPLTLCGIRLRCREHFYPWRIAIEGRATETDAWQTLLPETPGTLFFWSGPRWYWFGLFHRQEYRWPPTTVSELRVRFLPAEKEYRVVPEEMVLLMPDAEHAVPTHEDVKQLEHFLTAHEFRKVFADRWVCAQLAADANRSFDVVDPSFVRRDAYSLLEPTRAEYATVENLGRDTAFVAEVGDANACRTKLEALGVEVDTATVGPWIVLWPKDVSDCDGAVCAHPGLEWSGQTLFKLPPARYLKHRAAWRLQRALGTSSGHERDELTRRALTEYPAFSQFLERVGAQEMAHGFPVRFENGVELCSFEITPHHARRGETVMARYRWLCPSNAPLENRIVFVHFQQGAFRFQDDHRLMENVPADHIAFQPFPGEVFEVNRTIVIPPDAPTGTYEILIGIYDAATNQRERPRTHLPVKRRATILPCALTIEP